MLNTTWLNLVKMWSPARGGWQEKIDDYHCLECCTQSAAAAAPARLRAAAFAVPCAWAGYCAWAGLVLARQAQPSASAGQAQAQPSTALAQAQPSAAGLKRKRTQAQAQASAAGLKRKHGILCFWDSVLACACGFSVSYFVVLRQSRLGCQPAASLVSQPAHEAGH